MPQIQTIIHQFELGGGLRILKWALLVLALFLLVLGYNLGGYKNMSNPEAMDTAQLARNIAEHKGYNTLFVRPFSMFLLQRAYADAHGPALVGDLTDRSQVRGMHPDIANPPVYPLLLAGMMKLGPGFRYQTAGATSVSLGKKHFSWNKGGAFWIYPPDFWISFLNQCLLLLIAVALFFMARRLFDKTVAWTSTVLFLGTDLFWRFAISGLSTILLILIFLGLACCLLLMEEKGREPIPNGGRLKLFAAAAGVLVGLGCLTRYSFGWLVIPAMIFTVLFLGQNRIILCLILLVSFFVVISPWLARNYRLSHTFFGTAGYAMYETTPYFPDYRLERSLNPDLTRVRLDQLSNKTISNTLAIIQDDLPRMGGSWISAFFLVGLLVNFRNPTLSRLRYFLLLCLPFLVVAQALGRTHLSEDSPVINSENLLILVAPLVLVFGVSLFFILLDQMNLPLVEFRYLMTGGFCALMCLPVIINVTMYYGAFVGLATPKVHPVSYPPYYPPIIQKTSGWMKENELMMSDIPWAVAWYGERQCLWLTLNAQSDFFNVYDYQKPIKAIYLTPVTMDSKFLSQWVRASEHSWGSFALESMVKKELPPYFPLKKAPAGFLPEQLFLTDVDRWSEPASAAAAPSN